MEEPEVVAFEEVGLGVGAMVSSERVHVMYVCIVSVVEC